MSEPVHGICFHGIGTPGREIEPGEARYWIAADAFLGMLDVLVACPAVRISFDDGNASDVEVAFEALRKRRLTASFFVLAGRLGSAGSLDAEALRELDRAGMTVGTHGMDHRPWPGLSARDRECELVEARAHIADAVGHAVDEAAVPLGAYDRRLLTELRRLGYRKVHTSDGRAARAGAWLQPRISVVSTDTPDSLKQQLLETPSRGKLAWLAAKGRIKRLR